MRSDLMTISTLLTLRKITSKIISTTMLITGLCQRKFFGKENIYQVSRLWILIRHISEYVKIGLLFPSGSGLWWSKACQFHFEVCLLFIFVTWWDFAFCKKCDRQRYVRIDFQVSHLSVNWIISAKDFVMFYQSLL